MIDPVTGWFEYGQLFNAPTAEQCQKIVDSTWLSRYPRPREIGFDNGSEFQAVFKELCENMGMKMKVSLPWNPQANAILERVHQVIQDCLVTMDLENIEIDEDDVDPFEPYLTKAAYAIRGAHHATHGKSPCQLVFGRDIFMPINVETEWDEQTIRKQNKIAKSNQRENSKRTIHHYNPGDWISIRKPGIIPKLSVPKQGPYKVIKHHENGMITYEKQPFQNDKVNQRLADPYIWRNPLSDMTNRQQ